jgi:hypothetical protein
MRTGDIVHRSRALIKEGAAQGTALQFTLPAGTDNAS